LTGSGEFATESGGWARRSGTMLGRDVDDVIAMIRFPVWLSFRQLFLHLRFQAPNVLNMKGGLGPDDRRQLRRCFISPYGTFRPA
jgi:hypothetical protein